VRSKRPWQQGLFVVIMTISILKMAEPKYYTKEGLDKLRKDLEYLQTVERPSISRQIAEARDKGDLSENAEYDAAKNAQGMLEMKIARLQDEISNARIIDESKMDLKKVLILCTVKLTNLKNGAVVSYSIVPESEANLKLGKISVTSPLSKGLLGKTVGDKVEIDVPAGKLNFEIIEISRS
jgi:transcription elongation factor GreA